MCIIQVDCELIALTTTMMMMITMTNGIIIFFIPSICLLLLFSLPSNAFFLLRIATIYAHLLFISISEELEVKFNSCNSKIENNCFPDNFIGCEKIVHIVHLSLWPGVCVCVCECFFSLAMYTKKIGIQIDKSHIE